MESENLPAVAPSELNARLGSITAQGQSVWCMGCGFEQKLYGSGTSLTHCPLCLSSAWVNYKTIPVANVK